MGACGGEHKAPRERGDRPVHPPAGWRIVRNRQAGFTIAAPRRWAARTRRGATLIRSRDRLVAITVAADRSDEGRSSSPSRYAQQLLDELPGFEGSVEPRVRHVRGTPYRTARVEGSGTLKTARRPQRITVAAYHRPGVVTYAAVVFRNPLAETPADQRVVERMLRTFRAAAPQR
jgi:hypothetical protein